MPTEIQKEGERVDRYSHIDESTLDRTDRLGLAYCRLSGWEWDDIVGPKPEGFDEMPHFIPGQRRAPGTREYYISPACKGIVSIIGEANANRYHWIFNLRRTEQEWLQWYCSTEKAYWDGDDPSELEPRVGALQRLTESIRRVVK